MKTTFFLEITVSAHGLEDQETFEGIDAGGTRTTIFCMSGILHSLSKVLSKLPYCVIRSVFNKANMPAASQLFCAKVILSVWHFCFAISLSKKRCSFLTARLVPWHDVSSMTS